MAITRIGNIANTLPDNSIANSKFTDIVNFKNIIINGDMSIAQRGTSTASITKPTLAEVDAKIQELKDAEANRLAKKESAKAKLAALGLDEEEIKAIIGI